MGVILMYVNDQFPPPLRFSSLSREGVPESLYGCSISYAIDMLAPYGFRLQHLSGPYALFVMATQPVGEMLSLDEFECFRDTRLWGSEEDFPIDAVRDWFFGVHESTELLKRVWGNVTA